jgi:hypothetical protein
VSAAGPVVRRVVVWPAVAVGLEGAGVGY